MNFKEYKEGYDDAVKLTKPAAESSDNSGYILGALEQLDSAIEYVDSLVSQLANAIEPITIPSEFSGHSEANVLDDDVISEMESYIKRLTRDVGSIATVLSSLNAAIRL